MTAPARGGRNQRIERVWALKEARWCADCGRHFPHYMMEWDHREDHQATGVTVAAVITRGPWSAVLEEIEKCDLVCRNCHGQRTWERQHV